MMLLECVLDRDNPMGCAILLLDGLSQTLDTDPQSFRSVQSGKKRVVAFVVC